MQEDLIRTLVHSTCTGDTVSVSALTDGMLEHGVPAHRAYRIAETAESLLRWIHYSEDPNWQVGRRETATAAITYAALRAFGLQPEFPGRLERARQLKRELELIETDHLYRSPTQDDKKRKATTLNIAQGSSNVWALWEIAVDAVGIPGKAYDALELADLDGYTACRLVSGQDPDGLAFVDAMAERLKQIGYPGAVTKLILPVTARGVLGFRGINRHTFAERWKNALRLEQPIIPEPPPPTEASKPTPTMPTTTSSGERTLKLLVSLAVDGDDNILSRLLEGLRDAGSSEKRVKKIKGLAEGLIKRLVATEEQRSRSGRRRAAIEILAYVFGKFRGLDPKMPQSILWSEGLRDSIKKMERM